MSIFKVPSSILKSLESIRSRFFNGQDPKSNKASWVKWNKVLTPKDKGGLGVSSLFALNRGHMLKWVALHPIEAGEWENTRVLGRHRYEGIDNKELFPHRNVCDVESMGFFSVASIDKEMIEKFQEC
ncbi:hypothetical protein Tco_0959610 [Tanacetum coccineum]